MLDRIEDVDFDVDAADGDYGEQIVQATLILEGDFFYTCQDFLSRSRIDNKLRLRIDRSMAEKLVERIAPYLG